MLMWDDATVHAMHHVCLSMDMHAHGELNP
jgi:hypothetical protein